MEETGGKMHEVIKSLMAWGKSSFASLFDSGTTWTDINTAYKLYWEKQLLSLYRYLEKASFYFY